MKRMLDVGWGKRMLDAGCWMLDGGKSGEEDYLDLFWFLGCFWVKNWVFDVTLCPGFGLFGVFLVFFIVRAANAANAARAANAVIAGFRKLC